MEQLAGRYELVRELGRGGHAVVFEAEDHDLGRRCAVKVLSGRSESQQSRLALEARALARLDHPNVLRVFDIGHDGDQDFVVMALCLGGSLAERVEAEGPLPIPEAVQILGQVLDALQHAHDHGVVHRDVKPQNILFTEEGTPKLADFGIARVADETRLTQKNAVMGSMAFMAPEQRLDAASVGPAADLYAAGATLYAVITGQNPVDLFTAAPDSPRWLGCPGSVRRELVRATRLDPSDRHGSATELAEALNAAVEELGAVHSLSSRDAVDPDAFPPPHAAFTTASSSSPSTEVAVDAMPARPAATRSMLLFGGVALVLAAAGLWWLRPEPRSEPVEVPSPVPTVTEPARVPVLAPDPEPQPTASEVPADALPRVSVRPGQAGPLPLGSWSGVAGGRPMALAIWSDDGRTVAELTTSEGDTAMVGEASETAVRFQGGRHQLDGTISGERLTGTLVSAGRRVTVSARYQGESL